MKNIAIVLAGGIGSRIGTNIPKQFIKVLGKPIMIYTLEIFQNNPLVDEIVLVVKEDYIKLAYNYCDEYKLTKVTSIVPGGSKFVYSCINGINSLQNRCTEDDIMIITSADRPFISNAEIDDSIRVCKLHGSGIAARSCSLCMFVVDKEDRSNSNQYLRDTLLQTATPWTFKYGGLKSALELYVNGALLECESYPIAIYTAAGNKVYFSKALPSNIKITEKEDVIMMEQLLLEARNKNG